MSSFNELMQKYVNTDYPVLLDLAKEAIRRLTPACKQVDPQHDGYYMLSSIILSAIGRDGVLTALEKKLLIEATGMKEADVAKFLAIRSPDAGSCELLLRQYGRRPEGRCHYAGDHLLRCRREDQQGRNGIYPQAV